MIRNDPCISDTDEFIRISSYMPKQNTTWVVLNEVDTGLRQILLITNNFYEAYGMAMHYIYCVESEMVGQPFISESETGICIPYRWKNTRTKPRDFVYILDAKLGESEVL